MEDTSTNEIVTLQIGSQANYLGTHFWNTQLHYLCQENSPIDARINWKERLDTDGQGTYSPRVLIYDLKSKFGALRRGNEAFQEVTGPRHDEHRSGEDSGYVQLSCYATCVDKTTGKPMSSRRTSLRYQFTAMFSSSRNVITLIPSGRVK